MIENIKASVTFSTPIKDWSFSSEISPPPGITAVIGRNGSGKSFLALETTRYLLYGKRALRGLAADYRTYSAEGTFRIRSRRYKIERRAGYERLTNLETNAVEATGAEAVTAKVVELMGYGLEVFDIANAAVQKQTDKLGQMGAAARKQLIDKVVGLTDYETIEKACRTEAKNLQSLAEALTQNLRTPVEPDRPEDYFKSEVVEATIKREREARREYDRVQRATEHAVSAPTQRPTGARVSQAQVDEASAVRAQFDATQKERTRLEAIIAKRPPLIRTEVSIQFAERRWAWEWEVDRRGPRPVLPLADAQREQQVWSEIALRRRMSNEEAQCPSCGFGFRVGGEIPEEPAHGLDELNAQIEAHRLWSAPLDDEPSEAAGALDPQDAAWERKLIVLWEEAKQAEEDLACLPLPVDTFNLEGLRHDLAQWQRYDMQLEAFEQAVKVVQAAQAELEKLEVPLTDAELDQMQHQLTQAKLYEQARDRFDKDSAEFLEKSKTVAELTRRAAAYKEGSKNLASARAEFKANLAPQLSRIASSLIYQMSAGALTSVGVDEDMEITVDGQRIETLSGAGETVANLALRIALGQALVADAFPVFLGDEIDSDADEERRAATKLALLGLKETLSQIILITHRAVDIADLVVDLG